VLAVLFSRYSIGDKIGIYFLFVVVTLIGALTVCPCTGAHFFLAPIGGMLALLSLSLGWNIFVYALKIEA
jgi:hypothetical protein